MSRGDLRWRLTVPPDGSVPLDGAGPLLIEWKTGPHPAERLPNDECMLIRLTVMHPAPERVKRMLAAIGLEGPVAVLGGGTIGLAAEIVGRAGVRRL